MRAVAYSIRSFEKEPLARANSKKHDITLISNPLGLDTATFAEGKEAVIISPNDDLSEAIINKLADLGVKFITVRSADTRHVDQQSLESRNIKFASVNVQSKFQEPEQFSINLQEIATKTISNLDRWQQNKCAGDACICSRNCDMNEGQISKSA